MPVLVTRPERDRGERGDHQHVPLPPRGVPGVGEDHRDHRLGQQHVRHGHREQQPAPLLPVQPPVPDGREPVQGERGDPEQLQALGQLLRRDRLAQRRQAGEGDHGPAATTTPSPTLIQVCERGPGAQVPEVERGGGREPGGEQEAHRVRHHETLVRPGSRMPGVASACSPRKAAPVSSAIETRNSRASLCLRAISLVSRPSPTLSSAASSTIQKCIGSWWYMTSSSGAESSSARPATGTSRRTPSAICRASWAADDGPGFRQQLRPAWSSASPIR